MGLSDSLTHYNGMRKFLNGLTSHLEKLMNEEQLEGVPNLQQYKTDQYQELCDFIEKSFNDQVVNAAPYQPVQVDRRETARVNL